MNDENWTMIITPKRRLFDLQIRELIRYRDLVFLFTKRDFVIQYKQTILGPIWYVVNAVIATIMYTFIFGNLAKIGTDNIPHILFYYSGTMLWTFFSGCFTDSSTVFTVNANIFGKVYFPRLVVPISKVLINSVKYLIQFAMFLIMFIYFIIKGTPLKFSWFMLLFPLIVIWIAAIGTGAGIIVSSLTTKYRDLQQLVTFALGLAMYATPVVYPLSEIPKSFSWLAYANPLCAPIEIFRSYFFGTPFVSTTITLVSSGFTILLVFAGLILFNQNEKNFIDVI